MISLHCLHALKGTGPGRLRNQPSAPSDELLFDLATGRRPTMTYHDSFVQSTGCHHCIETSLGPEKAPKEWPYFPLSVNKKFAREGVAKKALEQEESVRAACGPDHLSPCYHRPCTDDDRPIRNTSDGGQHLCCGASWPLTVYYGLPLPQYLCESA